jgi:hypothetical protein
VVGERVPHSAECLRRLQVWSNAGRRTPTRGRSSAEAALVGLLSRLAGSVSIGRAPGKPRTEVARLLADRGHEGPPLG